MTEQTTTAITPLAADANREHRLASESAAKAVHHAIACGRILRGVKESLPHGRFGAWIVEHFEGSERSAQRYLRFAENQEKVQQASSIRTAEKLLATKTPRVADSRRERVRAEMDAKAKRIERAIRKLPLGEVIRVYEPGGFMLLLPSAEHPGSLHLLIGIVADRTARDGDRYQYHHLPVAAPPNIMSMILHDLGVDPSQMSRSSRPEREPRFSRIATGDGYQPPAAGPKRAIAKRDTAFDRLVKEWDACRRQAPASSVRMMSEVLGAML